MTAGSTQTAPRSRRALLAGALGGLGVWVASAIGRVAPAEAAAGDPIRMGRLNRARGTSTELQTSTSKPAFWARQLGGGHAIRAEAETGRAVMARAGSNGTGVWAFSPDHFAIHGESNIGYAGYFLAACRRTSWRFQPKLASSQPRGIPTPRRCLPAETRRVSPSYVSSWGPQSWSSQPSRKGAGVACTAGSMRDQRAVPHKCGVGVQRPNPSAPHHPHPDLSYPRSAGTSRP